MSGRSASEGGEQRALIDRAELYDLASAYARSVDRGDFEAFEALFVPGGRLASYRGPEIAGDPLNERWADGTLAGSIRKGLERYEVTTHFLGQQTVDVSGDRATAETYCLAHHVFEEAGERFNRVMSIRYLDRCRRTPEGWRFEERVLVIDWIEVRPLGRAPQSG